MTGVEKSSTRQSPPSRPLGVTLLAIVQMLSGIQMLIGGLWLLGASNAVTKLAGMVLLLGLVYVALGIWSFWFARGYLKGYEWARRRGRSVAILSIVLGIFLLFFFPGLPEKLSLSSPGWTIIHNLVIAVYLGSEGVRRYFLLSTRALAR